MITQSCNSLTKHGGKKGSQLAKLPGARLGYYVPGVCTLETEVTISKINKNAGVE